MTDFFGALETELRAAAARRPRRTPSFGQAVGAVAATALVGAAALVALVTLGGGDDSRTAPTAVEPLPVGTVIPKGEGTPPRRLRSIVVATGATPVAGPWQLEFSRSTVQRDPKTGEVYEPARLPCWRLMLLDPPSSAADDVSGECGSFPRTPGFTRSSFPLFRSASQGARANELIVYGRVPTQAADVVVTAPRGIRIEAARYPGPKGVRGDFYLVAVPPRLLLSARVNWLKNDGMEGSRGIPLAPGSAPIAGSKPPG